MKYPTVKQVKEAGFELHPDDMMMINAHPNYPAKVGFFGDAVNKTTLHDDDHITEFAWRDGLVDYAGYIELSLSNGDWKPSMKKWSKEMNDNQEIKELLNPVECGEQVEWNNGDKCFVENSSHDEITFIGLASNKHVAVCECITNERSVILDRFWVSDLLKEKPETPEQKQARERDEAITKMASTPKPCGFPLHDICAQLFDAGYRLQKGE